MGAFFAMSAPLTARQRRALLSHPAGWIATAGGAGLSPKAPGTMGSLVALLPWWFLLRGLPTGWYVAVVVDAGRIRVVSPVRHLETVAGATGRPARARRLRRDAG